MLNSRHKAIVTARKRGWSMEAIGFAAGISQQRAAQIIALYQHEVGNIKPRDVKGLVSRTPRNRFFFKCQNCGKSCRRGKTNSQFMYCNSRCVSDSKRQISDEMVRCAIDLRQEQNSWTAVSKIMKFSIQGIQHQIWLYLHKNGLLDRSVVRSIWEPRTSHYRKSASWKWLIGRTGLVPTSRQNQTPH